MLFTLNRDKTISSTLGHTVAFIKGEPTHVPPEMWSAVQQVGAVPAEELPQKAVVNSKEPLDPKERETAIHAAFAQLILSAKREDFTGTGVPHAKALEAVLGFRVDNKERDILWQKFKTKDAE